jgi:hypothetical protein
MASVTDSDKSPIVTAVQSDLDRWGLANTALAASALDMAQTLDNPEVSPTPRSMLHAQLRMTLTELAKLAPPEAANDRIDEVKAQWEKRHGAHSA